MELPKEAVRDSCSGRIQNPNMLDLKATDNQTGQMIKHICLTKKENKDQPEADASARVQPKLTVQRLLKARIHLLERVRMYSLESQRHVRK
jgi:hypothetical protein